MNGQEALEEGKFPTWVTPLRKKELHLTEMIEKKSLSIPHGINYWSGFIGAYLPSEIRFWATKAIYLNSGGASEILTTRVPTTWSVSQYEISYLILFWWDVYLLSFQSSHLTWAFTLLLCTFLHHPLRGMLRTLISTVVLTAFLECEMLWVLALTFCTRNVSDHEQCSELIVEGEN